MRRIDFLCACFTSRGDGQSDISSLASCGAQLPACHARANQHASGVSISHSGTPGMQIATPVLYSSIQSVSAPPALYSGGFSSGALPPAPSSAVQSAGVLPSAAFQPMTGMQWPQPTPYASPFVVPPAWPMYMPNVSYMPRPLTQLPFVQAQFEELARRSQDMEARELEIQRMSRSLNLKSVKKARAKPTTHRGSRDKRGDQTPGRGFDPLGPTAAQISAFLYELFDTHGLSPQTIKGYRSCLASVLSHTGRAAEVQANTISDMIMSMELQRPRFTPVLPQWDLGIVLEAQSKPPYEPLREASLKHLTLKIVFLLAMASGGRRSEL